MQEKLLILRKRNNITQKQMAKYIGTSADTYSKKERGKIDFNLTEMFLIKRMFHKRIDDIFLPSSHLSGDNKKEDAV